MADYELILLGSPPPNASALLAARLAAVAVEYGMVVPDDLAVRAASDAARRNARASTAALYFGGDPSLDAGLVAKLESACVPIVPVVPPGGRVSETIPSSLQAINAFFDEPANAQIDALAALALECLAYSVVNAVCSSAIAGTSRAPARCARATSGSRWRSRRS